jgi:hypothetical protein
MHTDPKTLQQPEQTRSGVEGDRNYLDAMLDGVARDHPQVSSRTESRVVKQGTTLGPHALYLSSGQHLFQPKVPWFT